MSGGVDSTACALLLREHYHIQGFFMHLAQPDFARQKVRVQTIAEKLGIELQIIDLRKEFQQKVLDYFTDSYFEGLTPNPCVICNREIKFGLFLDAILDAGMDKMATGHYAKLSKTGDLFRLFNGDDPKKDQSYFLSRLYQKQLAKIIFPLGDRTKEDIYQFVADNGFDDFKGLESQDICFLEKSTVGSFLDNHASSKHSAGKIVNISGKVLGSHDGLHRYTIGQRKGLGISNEYPLYVLGMDLQSNRLLVGRNEDLFKQHIRVKNLHWLAETPPDITKEYTVRIRYSHRGSTAKLTLHNTDYGEFTFNEPQRAVTPGQFAVVYNDNELIGSGVIV